MFEQVKQEINNKIKTNGNNEITAARLNGVLQDMMDAAAEEIENVAESVGDQVEANPTEEATATLNTIKIGETNYNIPQTDTSDLVTKQELQQDLSGKQDTINDLSDIRSGASSGATAVQPSTLNGYVQKSQTTGLLKNDGTVDTQTAGKAASALQPKQSGQYAQGNIVIFDANGGLADSQKKTTDFATAAQGEKADNAIPMPTGTDGQILEKDSNETSGVKWVQKPQDGKSALQIYNETYGTNLDEAQFINVLKQNYPMEYVAYNQTAAEQTIGTGFSAIDTLNADSTTAGKMYLMPNDGTTPTGTILFVTVQTPNSNPATYQWYSLGALSVPSDVLTQGNIVNDLITGGITDVLSAEQGKRIGDTLYGEFQFVTMENSEFEYAIPDVVQNLNVVSPYAWGNPPGTASEGEFCVVVGNVQGKTFKIFGNGGSPAIALYGWANAERIKISSADGYINTRTNGLVITPPDNAAYLYINFTDYDSTQDKLQELRSSGGLVDDVEEIQDDIEDMQQDIDNIPVVEVVDNLESNDATKALSAKQGKELNKMINGVSTETYIEQSLTADHYYNTNINYFVSGGASASGIYCCEIQVSVGDKYRIFGTGNNAAIRLYAFANSNRNYTFKSEALNTRTDGLVVTIPDNVSWLIVNLNTYDSLTDKVEKVITTTTGGYKEYVDEKINDIDISYIDKVLKNKKIVVFGDSLSEFKYNGKTWCNHFEDLSGASVVNLAIGGTQIRQRTTMAEDFDQLPESTSTEISIKYSKAYATFDIINLVTAALNSNLTEQSKAATWMKNYDGHDYSTQIAQASAIDWSEVNAVIIEGGGNDWNSGEMGTNDSTNVGTTLGALNEIIRLILTTYPHVSIFVMSNQVTYSKISIPEFSSSASYVVGDIVRRGSVVKKFTVNHTGEWNEADAVNATTLEWRKSEFFSDNATILGYTARQYYGHIKELSVLRHIAYCDIYNEIGWNEFNFSQYYIDSDNSHPYKGFSQIAEKVYGFIKTNRNFV